MNDIYLPTLKSIRIKDYSLYPGGLDFHYKFINGVNIIFGGNGLGKTTFISLIKYGLIGLYEKGFGHRRTYKGKQIAKRKSLPAEFFSSRMADDYGKNKEAKVVLTFKIHEATFEVTRTLYDPTVERVKVTEKNGSSYDLTGKVIQQDKYDRLEDSEKKGYLQKKFEDKVAECSNLYSFDDLIFFVTEILFFEENHKTILWFDNEEENIATTLSSKYWNDPKLDNDRQRSIDQHKYHDSLARHKSEDIRSIQAVIDSLQDGNDASANVKNVAKEMSRLKEKMNHSAAKLDSIYKQKESLTVKRNLVNNDLNLLIRDINILEARISKLEFEENKKVWEKVNPLYKTHISFIKINNLCPMCNKPLKERKFNLFIKHDENCFVCEEPLSVNKASSDDLAQLERELRPSKIKRQQLDSEIAKIDDKLNDIETAYRDSNEELFTHKSQLWALEHSQTKASSKDKGSLEFNAMLARINKLEKEKLEFQTKSKNEKKKVDSITAKIEEQNIRITAQLSMIFSEFAEKFLSVPCKLTYDDFDDNLGRRFVPIINSRPRLSERQLSESQRFFIDHSYRMSLLHFFYRQPTFFVCETPDSSLDISYERNAADVFLTYLKQPNALILTSNLNNSEFLQYIVEKAPKIGYVNLLEIGRPSQIQQENSSLKRLLTKITTKLEERD